MPRHSTNQHNALQSSTSMPAMTNSNMSSAAAASADMSSLTTTQQLGQLAELLKNTPIPNVQSLSNTTTTHSSSSDSNVLQSMGNNKRTRDDNDDDVLGASAKRAAPVHEHASKELDELERSFAAQHSALLARQEQQRQEKEAQTAELQVAMQDPAKMQLLLAALRNK